VTVPFATSTNISKILKINIFCSIYLPRYPTFCTKKTVYPLKNSKYFGIYIKHETFFAWTTQPCKTGFPLQSKIRVVNLFRVYSWSLSLPALSNRLSSFAGQKAEKSSTVKLKRRQVRPGQ